jgi:geranylgeranyl diphosphate synthase, type I
MDETNKKPHQDLHELLQERSKNIPQRFARITAQDLTDPELLQMLTDVHRYWKDMLRPSLVSLCCEAVGGNPNATEDISIMVTLISAGMGIHDDVIDKSSNKHHRMTLPGIHGADNAIVVGDLLIVKALSAIRELVKKIDVAKSQQILSSYEAAFVEMCEGELIEIATRKKLNTSLTQCNVFLWKFGSDTEVCARIGAILGNGTEEQVTALSQYGRRLGYLYRLIGELKDTLNVEGNLPERLQNESIPLPILFAASKSKQNYEGINCILKRSKISADDIKTLLEICFSSEAFDYIKNTSKENTMQAKKSLNVLAPSNARNALSQLVSKYMEEITSLCL